MNFNSSQLTAEVQATVKKLVKRNAFKFKLLDRESDILQEIYLKLIQPSSSLGTSYLQRFDPTKNSLDGFLSPLIFNHFCRASTRNKYAVEQARSLDDLYEFDEPSQQIQIPYLAATSQRIVAALETQFPHTSGILYKTPFAIPLLFIRTVRVIDHPTPNFDENIIWRSCASIFSLMMMGLTQEEVSLILCVSKGWISKQVYRIRHMEELEALAEELGYDQEAHQARKSA